MILAYLPSNWYVFVKIFKMEIVGNIIINTHVIN